MNLSNCKSCYAILTQYSKIPICKNCEEKYKKLVKEYLNENGNKTPQEIKEATGVPLKVINYFIEEGILCEDELNSINELKKYKQMLLLKELGKAIQDDNQIEEQSLNERKIQFHIKGKK